MARITNYSTLVEACKAKSENDSTEFNSYIPTAIGLAESRIIKEVDSFDVQVRTTITVSAGVRFLDKPNNYRVGHNLFVTTSAGETTLTKRTESFVKDYWPVATSTGEVKYYADSGRDRFILGATPVSTYPYVLDYTGDVTPLTSANPVNVLVCVVPDVLFHATMKELMEFNKDYEATLLFENNYKEARMAYNNENRRSRRDDEEAPTSFSSGHNTINEGAA